MGRKKKKKNNNNIVLIKHYHKTLFSFKNCLEKNKCIKDSIKAHKRYFKITSHKKTIEQCIKKCKKSTCLLRQCIDENRENLIIFQDTTKCNDFYCPEHEICKTYCAECKIELSEYEFTRQLCGKKFCNNNIYIYDII